MECVIVLKISLVAEHQVIRSLSPETADKNGRRNDQGYERLPIRVRKRILTMACKETRGDDLANVSLVLLDVVSILHHQRSVSHNIYCTVLLFITPLNHRI